MRGNPITQRQVNKMLAFKSQGFSHSQIAVLMKLGESTIYRYVPQTETLAKAFLKPDNRKKSVPVRRAKAQTHYSIACSKEVWDYVTDLALKQGQPKRDVMNNIVVKHSKSWFNF